jgi:uncharacterized membrane-anchored protein
MKPNHRKWLIAVISLQVLILCGIVGTKERLLRTGQTVKLELVPIDPRSLMQGDYVRLNYRISSPPPGTIPDGRYRVKLVLSKDENGVHQFTSLYKAGTTLEPEDALITGWVRSGGRLVFGIENFFVPENTGLELEQTAKYGLVKLSATGDALLVGLEK